jgi:prepilin-type N-terminal cleavage/methylation domain-containing protein
MQQQRGFTLIELLIALGVMAVFALLAYRGLDSVLRLHQGAYAHEQQAQAIDRAITQLEADLRQASNAKLIAPAQEGSVPRLQLQRRIDAASGSALATVEWAFEGAAWRRRSMAANLGESSTQTAELLTVVSEPSWLSFAAADAAATGAPAVSWRVLGLAEVLAQPTKSLEIQRGVGVRLTVAGKPLEKLFLVGR